MPRRESYRTDDEDDDLRRGAASGGGIPGWVWVLGGGGVLAAVVVVGLAFLAFSSRREMVARQEFARADLAHAEAATAQMKRAQVHEGGPVSPLLPLATVTEAYRHDQAAADNRYTDKQLRLRVRVVSANEQWVGAAADLGMGLPVGRRTNVRFELDGAADGAPVVPVAPGTTVIIEGRCDGLTPDPDGRPLLTFTDCRVVRE